MSNDELSRPMPPGVLLDIISGNRKVRLSWDREVIVRPDQKIVTVECVQCSGTGMEDYEGTDYCRTGRLGKNCRYCDGKGERLEIIG